MNSKHLFVVASFAAAFVGAARADDADASQYVHQFESSRTRAEVMAEARAVAATRSTEPAGSRVIAAPQSTLQPAVVRAQAAEAVRLGKIPSGEIGL